MGRETERKFIVGRSDWRSLGDARIAIVQFYLASGADRSVRIRIRDGVAAILTLKFGGGGRSRDEFEYPVPVEEARDMMRFALDPPIEKTRHLVRHRGRLFEVDEFHGRLAGLVMAELETEDDVPDSDLPTWLGREVTGDPAYYNAALAAAGLPEAAA